MALTGQTLKEITINSYIQLLKEFLFSQTILLRLLLYAFFQHGISLTQ